LEVNARPWWFVEFAANCGVNFLEMVYLDALGRETEEVDEYAVGKYFIHPYYDISACLREAPSRLKGLARFLAAGPGADRPVMRWSDPLPAFAEFYSLAGNFLERRIGREDG
jgi:predicted ATP-grasp superfamily ATP-dependent carboligase